MTPWARGQIEPLVARPVTVSMFKNGLGMVTSRAELGGAGDYRMVAPEARYGSFWISWEDGISLEQIVVGEVVAARARPAHNLVTLLRANVGKAASIRLVDRDEWITGTLKAAPDLSPSSSVISPFETSSRARRSITPVGPDLVLIETSDGMMAVSPGQVAQVRFDPEDFEGNVEETLPALTFSATPAAGEGTGVTLRYLTQGISWSPSYAVELTGEDRVRLSYKAVIVNDLMDLEGVNLELIAGYPNIAYAQSPSAFSTTSLQDLLASLGGSSGYQRATALAGNSLSLSQVSNYSNGNAAMRLDGEGGELTAGLGEEDLFFYQLPQVQLAKGDRGYFTLIQAEVPARHVYSWEIPRDTPRNRNTVVLSPTDNSEVVWHALELTNTTNQPWSTASGMTMKAGRVLGQDILHFIPVGATGELRITRAISIDACREELEIGRAREVVRLRGRAYDRVVIEGRLTITNYKDESVVLKISKTVDGEMVSADGDPQITKVAAETDQINLPNLLEWEVEVSPGRENTVTLVYRYHYFTT